MFPDTRGPPPQRAERAAAGSVDVMPLLACLALLLALLLSGCSPARDYEGLLMLFDFEAGQGPSRLKQVTPPPKRSLVRYAIAGRGHSGDLYLPGDGPPLAGIVLVPGAVPRGKDDPRLVAFATTLARARFAVLAPDLPGFRRLRIGPGDSREVADAFLYLAGQPALAPQGRAGLGGFSYALGPVVLAALEDDIRCRVRFVLGVGGYYNLPEAIRFFTTGYFREDGRWHRLKPDDHGKWVFVNSSLKYLQDARDRRILEAMMRARLRDREADLSALAAGLGPEGRAVYDLLANADPARTPALIQELPGKIKRAINAMSLHDKDLGRLRARLILVHGMNDDLVPYPQSAALAQAAPAGLARLYLIHRILEHVEFRPSRLFSWQFLSRDLPDLWRMHRAVAALLAEREAGPEKGR